MAALLLFLSLLVVVSPESTESGTVALGHLVVLEGEEAEGVPILRGGLNWPQTWPGESAAVNLAQAGRAIGAGTLHRDGKLATLHGWAQICRAGPLSMRRQSGSSVASSAGSESRPVVELRTPDGEEIVFGPGPRIVTSEGEWGFGTDESGRWTQDHHCAHRTELRFEPDRRGSSTGTTTWQVVVSGAGTRIDVAGWLLATRVSHLPEGIPLEWQAASESGLRLGDRAVPDLTGEREYRFRAATWWEGDLALGAGRAGEGVILRRIPVAFRGGLYGASSPDLIQVRDAREFRLWLLPPNSRLASGEGRIVRAILQEQVDSIALAPAVVVPTRMPGVPHDLLVAARSELTRLLSDRRSGYLFEGEAAGDWRLSEDRVGNLEFDTLLGLLVAAEAGGGGEVMLAARAAADHSLALDRDAAGTGLFFMHGETHRNGGVEPGHHWVEGLLRLQSKEPEVVRAQWLTSVLTAQLAHFRGVDLETAFPRSLGWGLHALDGAIRAQVGGKEMKTELKRWRTSIVETQTSGGWLALSGNDDRGRESEESVFVQAGIVLPSLLRSLELIPDSIVEAAARRLSRALNPSLIVKTEEGLRVRERVVLDRRLGKVVRGIGYLDGEEAVLALTGGWISGREPIREQPRIEAALREQALRLRAPSRRYSGREVSLLWRGLAWVALAEETRRRQNAIVPLRAPSPSR